MFLKYRTKGFILKKENRGEADQLLCLYSQDFGKIKVLAKSIRNLGSKLRGASQVLFLSEIEFIYARNGKILTDAMLIRDFPAIRKDLLKLRLALRFSRIFSSHIKGETTDKRLWDLIENFFSSLEIVKLSLQSSLIFYYFFLWNFLKIQGYQPELQKCVLCRQIIDLSSFFWKSSEGGVVCKNCSVKKEIRVQRINPHTLMVLRSIFSRGIQDLLKMRVDSQILQNLKIITKHYFNRD